VRGSYLLILLLLFLLALPVMAQDAAPQVTLVGDPTVQDGNITLKLAVRTPAGLGITGLGASNFSVSEPSEKLEVTSDASLPSATAIIVNLSNGSSVDLIQGVLRAYLAANYPTDDRLTFYILDGKNATPRIETPGSQASAETLVNGFTRSDAFYTITPAVRAAVDNLRGLTNMPRQALYVGSFLFDWSEVKASNAFALEHIPFHVVQAHRGRDSDTPLYRGLASNGGGLFADDAGGALVKDGAAVGTLRSLYDTMAAARTLYTLRYHTLSTSLDKDRAATVTVALSGDQKASVDYHYQWTFQPPKLEIVSGDFDLTRKPTASGFDVNTANIRVKVSFPDGVTRRLNTFQLAVQDGDRVLQTVSFPQQPEADGSYAVSWPLTDFNQPGTRQPGLDVTAADELGLSASVSRAAKIVVLAPPTATPASTAVPTVAPTVVPTAAPAESAAALPLTANPAVQALALVVVLLAVAVIILLLALRRSRGQAQAAALAAWQAEQAAQAAAAAPQSNGIANGAHPEPAEKPLLGRLIVLDGLTEQQILIDSEEFVIGRSTAAGCNYVIDKPYVNGRHCMFIVRNGSFSLRDLNTKNGTFVNGERLPGSRDVDVPVGSEVGITSNIRLEFWDAKTPINVEQRLESIHEQSHATQGHSTAGDFTFHPLIGVNADEGEEITDDYSPI
jgi:pSer/pThr/pTyr-binding forkhead associated (FHA) protein